MTSEAESQRIRPKIIFVTGPPGVGKSRFAMTLGERFLLPVFSKDDIKEPLLDLLRWTDQASTRRHGAASYEILCRIIRAEARAGRSIIVESPFQTHESSPIISALQKETGFEAMELLCSARADVLHQRLLKRAPERHPGHFDEKRLQRLGPDDLSERYESPLLIESKTVALDLSDLENVDYGNLFKQVASFLG